MDSALVDALLSTKLTLFERLMVLYSFIGVGLLICVQLSQTQADQPLWWTKLNKENRPYWFTLYVLAALLLVTSSWPALLKNMAGYVNGYEERILNTVWIGLLSLESLMVLGVVLQGLVKRFGPQPKLKTN